jgi:hypothetical protein
VNVRNLVDFETTLKSRSNIPILFIIVGAWFLFFIIFFFLSQNNFLSQNMTVQFRDCAPCQNGMIIDDLQEEEKFVCGTCTERRLEKLFLDGGGGICMFHDGFMVTIVTRDEDHNETFHNFLSLFLFINWIKLRDTQRPKMIRWWTTEATAPTWNDLCNQIQQKTHFKKNFTRPLLIN